jgi:hypothetical protein
MVPVPGEFFLINNGKIAGERHALGTYAEIQRIDNYCIGIEAGVKQKIANYPAWSPEVHRL